MYKYFVYIGILFLSIECFAQGTPISQVLDPNGLNKELLYRKESKPMTGYPELLDKYVQGELIFTGGKSVVGVWLNYDLLKNQVLINQDNVEFIVPSNDLMGFRLHDGLLTRSFVKMDDKYYEVLFNGNTIDFYRLYEKQIIRKVATNTSYNDSNSTQDRIEEVEIYFVDNGNGLKEIQLKRKDFEDYLGEDFVKSYKSDYKINFRQVNDIIALLNNFENNEEFK